MSGTYVLYRFFNNNGELLYVGRTANPGNRITKHEYTKDWWREVHTITLEHFSTSLEQAESDAISTENPMYNVSGNHKSPSYYVQSIMRKLSDGPMTKTEIGNLLNRNFSAEFIDMLIKALMDTGKVESSKLRPDNGIGRSKTVFMLKGAAT